MVDLTEEIKGSDVRLKVKGAKLTRLDMVMDKAERLKEKLDSSKPILTVVYENGELVERVKGSFKDTKEIIEYYNNTFVLQVGCNVKKNAIVVFLVKYLKKPADKEEDYK